MKYLLLYSLAMFILCLGLIAFIISYKLGLKYVVKENDYNESHQNEYDDSHDSHPNEYDESHLMLGGDLTVKKNDIKVLYYG